MITRPWHTGPLRIASNQRQHERVSLVIRCTEHSHASKPSTSPIKVTNIENMYYYLILILMLLQFKLSWNEVYCV